LQKYSLLSLWQEKKCYVLRATCYVLRATNDDSVIFKSKSVHQQILQIKSRGKNYEL